jgi:hypothetical protein
MPHYLGELMAIQVKQTSFLILLSMWVTVMLTIMSLGAALVLQKRGEHSMGATD